MATSNARQPVPRAAKERPFRDPDNLKRQLRLPVIGAPLFIISNPALVIAQCKAGIVGSFPALNARPAPVLEEWLKRITSELAEHDAKYSERRAAPFAVNQIVHRSNDRLAHDLDVCTKYKVPIVITSLGAREDVNEAAHSYGGIVFHDVINQAFAKKAVEKGADGLILVAAGAGGHAGTTSPFAFVQETRQWFEGPIALSGAIATGRAVLAAQAMGADFAYIGSAFIATTEANANPSHKQAVAVCDSNDIVYSNLFTGIHGNYLRPSIVANGLDSDNLPLSDPSKMDFGSGGNTGKKAWKDIWGAGQGIGAIGEVVPVADFVDCLEREYFSGLTSLLAIFGD
jgi:nitronate monooxygenase